MLSAIAFLTVAGSGWAPDHRTLRWFPVVGAGIGALVSGSYLGAHHIWPAAVAGVIVVAADVVITGGLHIDGLADSADGLLPHLDRSRRLDVMAEPTLGVFATVAIVVTLLARWAVFTSPDLEPLALIAVWAASRTVAAVVPALVRYARPTGLALPFLDGSRVWLALWLVPASIVLVLVAEAAGAVAVLSIIGAPAAIVWLAWRRLGGFTGDVLGAVIVVGETVALLALAAAKP